MALAETEESIAKSKTARNVLRPTVNAAVTISTAARRDFGDVDLTGLADELSAQCDAISRGDMSRPEALLTTQAHTLDAVFNDLARLAYCNWHNLDVAERLLRLAFKAQAQSRATVETIGILRMPPMVFARQANIANGPQQVNNESPTCTRENRFEPNKLLEKISGEWLDPRATGEAGGSDSTMAAMGAFDRPTKRPGKGKSRTERR
jgi:hypothetical protein